MSEASSCFDMECKTILAVPDPESQRPPVLKDFTELLPYGRNDFEYDIGRLSKEYI